MCMCKLFAESHTFSNQSGSYTLEEEKLRRQRLAG
jgi:hypothetical protein